MESRAQKSQVKQKVISITEQWGVNVFKGVFPHTTSLPDALCGPRNHDFVLAFPLGGGVNLL